MLATVPIRADLLITEARERARRRRIRIAVLLAAGSVSGWYVFSWSAAQSSAPTQLSLPNPCALLSSGQVGSALGLSVAWSDIPDVGGRTRACRWTTASLSKPQYPEARRTLLVFAWPTTQDAFEQNAKNDTGIVRITNLGVPAYAISGAANELNVWKDGIALSFVIEFVTDPISTAETVAHSALEKI